MKLVWAWLVYLLMGLVLGCGILLTVKGNPWLLLVSLLGYLVLVAKIGCLPKSP